MMKFFRNRIRWGLFVFSALFVIFSIAFIQNGSALKKIGPLKGYLAPNFTLADLQGNNIELNRVTQENKATLINFWGIWCPYCVREIPELVNFYQKYHNRKVEILAVNVGDNPGTVPDFVRKNRMNFPVLIDKSDTVNRLYQISGFPTTFILDRQGKIRDIIVGATDLETLTAKVDAILEGK